MKLKYVIVCPSKGIKYVFKIQYQKILQHFIGLRAHILIKFYLKNELMIFKSSFSKNARRQERFIYY